MEVRTFAQREEQSSLLMQIRTMRKTQMKWPIGHRNWNQYEMKIVELYRTIVRNAINFDRLLAQDLVECALGDRFY